MEKSQQLKPETEFPVFNPARQFTGVFITAIVLFLIQSVFLEKYLPGHISNPAYEGLLISGIILFYSLDHLFDLFKFEKKSQTVSEYRTALVLLIVLSAVSLGIFGSKAIVFLQFDDAKYGLIAPLLYLVMVLFPKLRVRGLKELSIAVTVSYAVFYPVVVLGAGTFLVLFVPFLILCFMNLMMYSYFEKKKDEFFGFNSMYMGLSDYTAFRRLISGFLTGSILLLLSWVTGFNKIPGVLFVAALYWLIVTFHKKFTHPRMYRWLLDFLLLFSVIAA